jgi:hypothetical protein
MQDNLIFAIACMALFVAQGLDVLVTRQGIWYHGGTEGNPLFRKLLPLKAYKFLFNTAGGAFCDFVVRALLITVFASTCAHFGYADDAHSYLPFGIAGMGLALVARNYWKMRKNPTTKTIGQVS